MDADLVIQARLIALKGHVAEAQDALTTRIANELQSALGRLDGQQKKVVSDLQRALFSCAVEWKRTIFVQALSALRDRMRAVPLRAWLEESLLQSSEGGAAVSVRAILPSAWSSSPLADMLQELNGLGPQCSIEFVEELDWPRFEVETRGGVGIVDLDGVEKAVVGAGGEWVG